MRNLIIATSIAVFAMCVSCESIKAPDRPVALRVAGNYEKALKGQEDIGSLTAQEVTVRINECEALIKAVSK